MNGLGPIVLGVGLQDGLNPCIFMTCAIFILYGLWLKANSVRVIWFRILFGISYLLGDLVFNFGPAQLFVFQKSFIFIDKILYFILGVFVLVFGILSLKDWFLLTRGSPVKDMPQHKIKPFMARGVIVLLTAVLLALVLSAMATAWPINSYFMILGNELVMKGRWGSMVSLIVGYVFCSIWPLWILWAFLSIKNLRPSLFKIIDAVIFLTASTAMIFIFK